MDEHTQYAFDHSQPRHEAPEQVPEGLSAPRRRLGRGISSLLGDLADDQPRVSEEPGIEMVTDEFTFISEGVIGSNPYQPRKEFDEAALAELVDSIKQHGVLQPLLVRPFEGGYQLIAGERRLLAARRAGLAKVPCRVVELDERGVCEVAIIENVQRTDLNDLEKAQAFQEYLDKFGSSIEELAGKLGKNRSTVSNCLRLLELPDFVKIALQNGRISAGHARALLPLDEEAEQIAMCQRIESEKLSVRQAEDYVRQKQQPAETLPFEGGRTRTKSTSAPPGNHVLDMQRQLREILGTKVDIRLTGKESGRLIVHFSSHDEFERVVGFLRKAS